MRGVVHSCSASSAGARGRIDNREQTGRPTVAIFVTERNSVVHGCGHILCSFNITRGRHGRILPVDSLYRVDDSLCILHRVRTTGTLAKGAVGTTVPGITFTHLGLLAIPRKVVGV